MDGGLDSWLEGGSRRVGARRGAAAGEEAPEEGVVSRKGPCNFSINKFPLGSPCVLPAGVAT